MFDFNLTRTVRVFTRVSAASKSVFDLIFVNSFVGICSVTVADGISDHKLVLMTLELFPARVKGKVFLIFPLLMMRQFWTILIYA